MKGVHFTCNFCLETHVATQAAEDPGKLQGRKGRVLCPLAPQGCEAAPFSHTDLARRVPEEVFARYMRGHELAVEARVVAEVHQAIAAQPPPPGGGGAAASTGAAAGGGGGAAGGAGGDGPSGEQLEGLKRHIVDKILTLACPRCAQAFVDFDGCCALSCPRCSCSFCAYCLLDCGGDAHGHVARCQWNPRREVFSRKERFLEAQAQRRLRMLRTLLASLPPASRSKVLDYVARELRDLDISP
ncbi:hypothetical protein T484DRAFT_1911800, partial [Baffinella frigidus]